MADSDSEDDKAFAAFKHAKMDAELDDMFEHWTDEMWAAMWSFKEASAPSHSDNIDDILAEFGIPGELLQDDCLIDMSSLFPIDASQSASSDTNTQRLSSTNPDPLADLLDLLCPFPGDGASRSPDRSSIEMTDHEIDNLLVQLANVAPASPRTKPVKMTEKELEDLIAGLAMPASERIPAEAVPLCQRCRDLLYKFMKRCGTRAWNAEQSRDYYELEHSLFSSMQVDCPVCRKALISWGIYCEANDFRPLGVERWTLVWKRSEGPNTPPHSLSKAGGTRCDIQFDAKSWCKTRQYMIAEFSLILDLTDKQHATSLPQLTDWRASPSDLPNIHLAKSWMEDCALNHQCMSNTRWCPDRLICREEGYYRIIQGNQLNAQYMALSHRWGEADLLDRACLLQSNIEEWSKSLPEQLPTAHAQALQVAELLGFKYVWIDSLCIIQDSPADWTTQASKMMDIYSNAALVLCALDGDDEDGFFHERDPFTDLGFSLDFGRLYGDRSMPLFSREIHLIWASNPNHFRPFPLQKRGWACQERLLAARVLCVSEKRVTWLCDKREDCELSDWCWVGDRSVRNLLRAPEPTLDDFFHAWHSVVAIYAQGQLTYGQDKLIAIAGVAQKLSQKIDGKAGRYLAGLWETDLYQQLLWSATPEDHVPEYVAPSWSWASLDPVGEWAMEDTGPDYFALGEVLDCDITLNGGYAFGKVTDGFIQLRGFLWDAPLSESRLGHVIARSSQCKSRSQTLRMWPHSLHRYKNGPIDTGIVIRFLVLEEANTVHSHGPTFRRLGYEEIPPSDGPFSKVCVSERGMDHLTPLDALLNKVCIEEVVELSGRTIHDVEDLSSLVLKREHMQTFVLI